jgi:SH3 domain-containing YSC84-like protein 1
MKLHNPLPQNYSKTCVKAASILEHFRVRGRSELDDFFIPKDVIERARGIAILTVVKAGCLG